MSLPRAHTRYFVEEYLALEREAEERHEYLDGQIYAMAGESPEHGAICTNIGGQLYTQLRGEALPSLFQGYKSPQRASPEAWADDKGPLFLSRPAGRLRRA